MNYKVIFIGILVLQSCSSSNETIITTANQSFLKGEYEKAILQYNQVLALNDHDCKAYVGRADCNMILGNYKIEILDLLNAIKYGCSDGRIYNNLGDAYYNTEQFEVAIKQFEVAEALDFELSNTKANIGLCYSAIGQKDKATKYFEDAISINPDSALNYYLLATHYQQYDDLDKALVYINKAILLKYDFSTFYIKRAAINIQLKNYKMSLVDAESALKMNPKDSIEIIDALWIKTECLVANNEDSAACISLRDLRKFSHDYDESDFGITCNK